MFCRKCGKETGDTDVFCGACGQATNTVLAVNPQASSTSATKVAIGVFVGMIAVIAVVATIASDNVVPIVCLILFGVAIFVAVGGLKKHLH